MKIKTLVCALCATTVLGSCSFDDGELWNAVNSQEERLSALEKWQKSVETQLGALQGIISATDYVTGVEAVEKDGVKGYKISFLHAQPITLYYNEGGEISGSSSVGVAQEEGTNKYYWTMDGEPLMVDGKKVYVSGNDAVSMKPNAENPEIFDLTIGDYTVTVDQNAVGAHPIKGVEEKDGKVIVTLNDNTKKELVKYVDFSTVINESYENPAGEKTYPLSLPKGFLMEALNVPAGWTIAVETTETGANLKVTYPESGEAKVKFIISDGEALSVIKEVTFTVGETQINWVTLAFDGTQAIVVPEGTEYVKVTGTTDTPPTLLNNICKPLKESASVKHIDLSEIVHKAAIPANAFYNKIYDESKPEAETMNVNTTIETIILPRVYKNVFDLAFKNCKALKSVTFTAAPEANFTGKDVFLGCDALEAIYVPAADVEKFKAYAVLQPYADKIQANPNEVPAE